jgi:hypothetical protein
MEKAANLAAKFFVRAGIGPDKTYLLTVVGGTPAGRTPRL